MEPFLSRIRIYPIKSLDPVEVQEAEVGAHSLRYDREFALLTATGHFMNGKRSGRVNELKAEYDLTNRKVSLAPRAGGLTQTFHLLNDQKKLEGYLTGFFGESISLVHNMEGQLMDIPGVSSVTVVSEASLQSLHLDFPDRTLEDVRLRFRANIEISGVDAFWEEQLIGEPGTGMRFTLGDVDMIGVSPRARCNVPPRDPLTGITDKTFIKRMLKSRENSLGKDSPIRSYGSLYHLSINTYLPENQIGKRIRRGDAVKFIEPVTLSMS